MIISTHVDFQRQISKTDISTRAQFRFWEGQDARIWNTSTHASAREQESASVQSLCKTHPRHSVSLTLRGVAAACDTLLANLAEALGYVRSSILGALGVHDAADPFLVLRLGEHIATSIEVFEVSFPKLTPQPCPVLLNWVQVRRFGWHLLPEMNAFRLGISLASASENSDFEK